VLTLRDLVVIVVGTVIGSGIYIVPATVLAQTGGQPGTALLVWVAGGALSLLGALTYAELSAMDPSAGGLYVYVRDAFGRLPAFLFGWSLFFVIGSGSMATLAVAAAEYGGQFVALGRTGGRVVSLGLIAVVTIVNVLGTRESAGVQTWTTGLKVAAIVLMSVALLAVGRGIGSDVAWWPASLDLALLSGAGVAMIGVLWAYEGWQYAANSAGEARDPQRTMPVGFLIGTVALIAIYLLANLAYLAALGPTAAARSPRIAAEATATILGDGAGKVIAAAIIVSMFSAANGLALTVPRVFFVMARDRVFFRQLGEIHPRFGTPALAVIAHSAWAAVLAVTGTFEQLFTYVIFAGWIFYALAAASLLVFRRTRPDAPRPYRVPWYPWTPILFMVAASALVLNTLVRQPLEALLGLGIVLLGAPAYAVWRRGRDGRVGPRGGT
jgi:APA family basic amino acid/polyamine antiporter